MPEMAVVSACYERMGAISRHDVCTQSGANCDATTSEVSVSTTPSHKVSTAKLSTAKVWTAAPEARTATPKVCTATAEVRAAAPTTTEVCAGTTAMVLRRSIGSKRQTAKGDDCS